ncbi:MAG: rhomboid family intramembrane serine protease [Nitrospirae bacterium]|nr:rhomboid family intramembrane serine protease [Nitrospirota bacterium]
MIPFKDDNPTTIFPFATIGLIAANAMVFILQVTSPVNPREITLAYGAIPNYLLKFDAVQPIHPFLTLFTSMFMHGGLFHLGGNMLYLWIFGNNIEDRLGHIKFVIFYILGGIVAAYSHAVASPSSMLPMVGASGAVSGILGAYVLLFPRAKVYTLVFFGFFARVITLPAVFVIGFWIVLQFINGILSRGLVNQGGVAWFAHIGGFVFGILLIKFFLGKSRRKINLSLFL